MTSSPLRIGTRGSPLALWQAHWVADRLRHVLGNRPVHLVEIETIGDRIRDVALTQMGVDGVFTKEIQRALLANEVDVAVHSLKDLPTTPVENLILAAVPERGPTGDVLVSARYSNFASLPAGATVATSSLRRKSQILHQRPDLRLTEIRGNVDTRLRKLREHNLDAIILAQAGLVRLNLDQHITEILDPDWMLPAVGQGALGLECRADDTETLTVVRQLTHLPTYQAVVAERGMLRGLGGGCQVPIGAAASYRAGRLHLRGVVLAPDGSQRIAAAADGDPHDATGLGQRLAELLLQQGARHLLS